MSKKQKKLNKDFKVENTRELIPLLVKDLCLESTAELRMSGTGYDELREALSGLVAYLLSHNMERLLNACYRLDVGEEKLRKVLAGDRGNIVSEAVADLILQREQEKLFWRKKYR